jgi:WD repeat-containing protein 59
MGSSCLFRYQHLLQFRQLTRFTWISQQKGSLPVSRIKAHNSRIYGIDWAHNRRNEIVTCSLDKTIKSWDIQQVDKQEPTATICTTYPVWRARNLPFGRGLLSLPQRGSTELEMWKDGQVVETFTGHNDVVKEFVWRKGRQSEFTL